MRLTSFSLKWKLNLWLYNSCCIHSGQRLVCLFTLREKASLFLGLLRTRNHDWNSAGVAYFRAHQRLLHTAFRDIDSLFSLFASQSEIGWTFGMQKQGRSSGKEQKICLCLEWSMKVLCDFSVHLGLGGAACLGHLSCKHTRALKDRCHLCHLGKSYHITVPQIFIANKTGTVISFRGTWGIN